MDEFDNAADEIRARIEVLRKKARSAAGGAQQASDEMRHCLAQAERFWGLANDYAHLVGDEPKHWEMEAPDGRL